MKTSRSIVPALVVVSALVACSGPVPVGNEEGGPSRERLAHAEKARQDLLAGTSAQAKPSAVLDGKLLAVTGAVNLGEIALAELALQRAERDEVRDLAEHILIDHTAAQAEQEALSAALDRPPVANVVSLGLTAQNALTFQLLLPLFGESFDRAYVDSQLVVHAQVLLLTDLALLPLARHPRVHTYLVDLRAAVAAHLEHARELRALLD